MKTRIVYIELKTHAGGHDDRGPAWIGRVALNKRGKTLQYKGKRPYVLSNSAIIRQTSSMGRPTTFE